MWGDTRGMGREAPFRWTWVTVPPQSFREVGYAQGVDIRWFRCIDWTRHVPPVCNTGKFYFDVKQCETCEARMILTDWNLKWEMSTGGRGVKAVGAVPPPKARPPVGPAPRIRALAGLESCLHIRDDYLGCYAWRWEHTGTDLKEQTSFGAQCENKLFCDDGFQSAGMFVLTFKDRCGQWNHRWWEAYSLQMLRALDWKGTPRDPVRAAQLLTKVDLIAIYIKSNRYILIVWVFSSVLRVPWKHDSWNVSWGPTAWMALGVRILLIHAIFRFARFQSITEELCAYLHFLPSRFTQLHNVRCISVHHAPTN